MKKTKNSYKKSGVNIDTAEKFTKYIGKYSKQAFKKKINKFNKSNIGSFASVFDIKQINIKNPLLVASTDGVGTKIEIANRLNKFDTIGIDLVAMCVNDLIVQGAKPLFFLDYIATNKILLPKMKKIIRGIINGCKIADCLLVGGETAEMPGTYTKNKFDLAGFTVGIVDKKKIITKDKVKNKNISDMEMLRTFNCGGGFCLITDKNKVPRIKKYFNKKYQPYEIGFISKSQKRINLLKNIKW